MSPKAKYFLHLDSNIRMQILQCTFGVIWVPPEEELNHTWLEVISDNRGICRSLALYIDRQFEQKFHTYITLSFLKCNHHYFSILIKCRHQWFQVCKIQLENGTAISKRISNRVLIRIQLRNVKELVQGILETCSMDCSNRINT